MTSVSGRDDAGGPANILRARRLGIDTQFEAVVFMRKDCAVCRAEGFIAHARVRLSNGERWVIATLYQVTGDLLRYGQAGLSESAWRRLGLSDGETIAVSHTRSLSSLSSVRGKVCGPPLGAAALGKSSLMSGSRSLSARPRTRPDPCSGVAPRLAATGLRQARSSPCEQGPARRPRGSLLRRRVAGFSRLRK